MAYCGRCGSLEQEDGLPAGIEFCVCREEPKPTPWRDRLDRTPEEAREALKQVVAAAFNRADARPRFSIPCEPRYDHDCILYDVVGEWVEWKEAQQQGRLQIVEVAK